MSEEELNEAIEFNLEYMEAMQSEEIFGGDYTSSVELKYANKEIEKLQQENQELKQRINKAYIEFYDLIYHQIGYKYDLDETDNEKIENLLKTLKGEKND